MGVAIVLTWLEKLPIIDVSTKKFSNEFEHSKLRIFLKKNSLSSKTNKFKKRITSWFCWVPKIDKDTERKKQYLLSCSDQN